MKNKRCVGLRLSVPALAGICLSAGNVSGAKEGLLLKRVGEQKGAILLMDRAYEDSKTRAFAEKHGFVPVVPPQRAVGLDRELYKQRNGAERFFRRLKAFRRVCTRYGKLDVIVQRVHLSG
jgi:transposase